MRRGSRERLGYRQVWLGRLWRQAGWGAAPRVGAGLQLRISRLWEFSGDVFVPFGGPGTACLVWGQGWFLKAQAVPFSQGWEGQRMLRCLSSIALVGLVPKGLFLVEKEGKISTDQHMVPQKTSGLKLREDSRPSGPSPEPPLLPGPPYSLIW